MQWLDCFKGGPHSLQLHLIYIVLLTIYIVKRQLYRNPETRFFLNKKARGETPWEDIRILSMNISHFLFLCFWYMIGWLENWINEQVYRCSIKLGGESMCIYTNILLWVILNMQLQQMVCLWAGWQWRKKIHTSE